MKSHCTIAVRFRFFSRAAALLAETCTLDPYQSIEQNRHQHHAGPADAAACGDGGCAGRREAQAFHFITRPRVLVHVLRVLLF